MKMYEGDYDITLNHYDKPIIVRIDGKKFSKYTKGLEKPFDENMSFLMFSALDRVMNEFHANAAYHQSDEVTLIFLPNKFNEPMFGGRIQKIASVTASAFASAFTKELYTNKNFKKHPLRHNAAPIFDSRAWVVPSVGEAANVLVWRMNDAIKNSVSGIFRWNLGHKAMMNLNQQQMIDTLSENGISYKNGYSEYNRTGRLLTKIKFSTMFEEREVTRTGKVVTSGEKFISLPFDKKILLLQGLTEYKDTLKEVLDSKDCKIFSHFIKDIEL